MDTFPCEMCRVTGRKKLRQRARGKGTRYGQCPYCHGAGHRPRTLCVVECEIPELNYQMVRIFFTGKNED
jgi:hypothetical protein